MLSGWLAGEKLTKKDGPAVIKAVYSLGNIWRKAVETNRHVDWNRDALYDRLIEERLPFWIEPWSTYTAKRPNKVILFEEFESFLLQCVRAMRRSNKMRTHGIRRETTTRVGATVATPSPTPTESASKLSTGHPSRTYAAVAAQSTTPNEAGHPPVGFQRNLSRGRNGIGQRPDVRCYKC